MNNPTIQLNLEQLNKIKLDKRILGIHSLSPEGNLIVICRDGFLRCVAFQGNTLEWLDTYDN
jgi:hypothetical protein